VTLGQNTDQKRPSCGMPGPNCKAEGQGYGRTGGQKSRLCFRCKIPTVYTHDGELGCTSEVNFSLDITTAQSWQDATVSTAPHQRNNSTAADGLCSCQQQHACALCQCANIRHGLVKLMLTYLQ
jgi:hypothetical protein